MLSGAWFVLGGDCHQSRHAYSVSPIRVVIKACLQSKDSLASESPSQHWGKKPYPFMSNWWWVFLYGALALIGQYQHSAFSVGNKPREKSKLGSLGTVPAFRKVEYFVPPLVTVIVC
jgi:hypothetical protein